MVQHNITVGVANAQLSFTHIICGCHEMFSDVCKICRAQRNGYNAEDGGLNSSQVVWEACAHA